MGLFDGSGRIGRLPYFGIALACWLAPILAFLGFVDVHEVTGEMSVNPLLFVVLVASTWLSVTNTVRRLHDLGRSGWTALLLAVPLIGTALSLYLLFAPGDPVRNLYGLPPGATAMSNAAQRERMELLTAAAGEAYRARAQTNYLNDDGSYNMEGLTTDGQSS